MSSELRAKLQGLLGVRCVFPNNSHATDSDFTVRCMLENSSGGKALLYKDSIEDVIVRLKSLTSIENDEQRAVRIKEIKHLLSRLFANVQVISGLSVTSPLQMILEKKQASTSLHPGIAHVLKFVEDKTSFVTVQSFAKHSLLSISRFHAATTLSSATLGSQSGLGSRDLRLRFIVYQLLQAAAFIHNQNLCLDPIEPSNIMLDDDMWLFLPVGISDRTCKSASYSYGRLNSPRTSPSAEERKAINTRKPSQTGTNGVTSTTSTIGEQPIDTCLSTETRVERPIGYYEPLTIRWINGSVSNFEYLMAINHAAGRTMMDPLYHPIIPWVTDFSCYPVHENGLIYGGLRDLTKTKFRLSKGDAQLETTFKHSDPPHHVPESLSELTYYIYLARRTPLQVLRRVVRDVFVPEHYPHSMGRIYDWTPDECIPEFYFDPTVLASIHKDCGLHDIELPAFAPTPAEFIRFHRSVLESDEVSRKLHRWIDLTFGYCLDGAAAVNNMNVPLHHTLSSSERSGIDAPDVNKNPGFVMLFDCPHPRRKIPCATSTQTNEGEINQLDRETGLFSFNHSNKFTAPADSANSLREAFGVSSLIALDQQAKPVAPRPSKSVTSNTIHTHKTELVRHDNSALLQANDLLASSAGVASYTEDLKSGGAAGQKKHGSFSMRRTSLRPGPDPSLAALRLAGDISLTDDPRVNAAITSMQTQAQMSQFSACFDNALDAVYALPGADEVGTEEFGAGLSSTAGHKGRPAWDQDFFDNIALVLDLVEASPLAEDEGARFIHDAQSDDMLAIGCIIAELFTGRPLMNRHTAASFTQAHTPAARDELVKFIYRQTSELPLVVRRVIALLLQPSPAARPKAVEILQACQKDDENRWSNKDFSLQRSGGSSAGFVDFQQILANRKATTPVSADSAAMVPPGAEDYVYHGGTSLSGSTVPSRLVKYLDTENEKESSSMHRSVRVELLSDYCNGLFPSYFRSVYSFVGELKLCRDGLVRMRIMLNKLDDILNIPLEGLNLAIRHILDVVSDAKPFCDTPEEQNRLVKAYASGSNVSNNPQWISIEGKKTLIGDYHRIVDVLGMRLGIDGTEKLLVPKVVDFLNELTSVEMLEHILRSPLWTVLLLRAGVRCFLRCFLPLLLTYISSGTLHHVSNGVKGLNSINVPLWAKGEYLEYNMWLSNFPLYVVQEVEQAAMSTIVSLMDPECMGPGLCARYLLPALLSLIGVPQLAGAGYGHSETEVFPQAQIDAAFEQIVSSKVSARQALVDQDRPDLGDVSPEDLAAVDAILNSRGDQTNGEAPAKESLDPALLPLLEKYIQRHAVYESQDRSIVRTVINLCMQLGDLVVSELILSKIFNSTLPDLVDALTALPSPGTVAALMEVVVLLNGILPSLCAETVQKDYLQPARISGMSLPKLLAKLPLAPSFCIADDLDDDSMRYNSLDEYINAQRRHNLHFELCRLIASSSMMAGAETCIEHVVPYVDIFFKNFVNAFGSLPVECKTMGKGFELGAELFLPLAQLTGPEAFYTLVQNLNPRLEMWLVSVGSSIPARSPPLPNNIWPELATEVEKEPRKKKGIMQWFSSKITKSTPAPAVAPTPSTISEKNVNNVPSSSVKPLVVPYPQQADDDYSPVSERMLNNAKTAKPYTTSVRKNNPGAGRGAVDIGQSPTFGTELMQVTQTPRAVVGKIDEEDPTSPEGDSPYHLMNNFESVRSPFEVVPETSEGPESQRRDRLSSEAEVDPEVERHHSERDREVYSTPLLTTQTVSPRTPLPTEEEEVLAAPNLNQDLDAEADDDNDASFMSMASFPPDGEILSSINESAAEGESQRQQSGQEGTGTDADNDVEDSGVPIAIEVVEEDTVTAAAVTEDLVENNILDQSLSSSFLENRVDSKLQARPYMSYQRLMAARRPNARSSVRSGAASSYTASKSHRLGTARKTKVTSSIFTHGDAENAEEIENRELYYNEMAWLLGGSGRWNIDQDLKEKAATMQAKAAKFGRYHNSGVGEWNPAAQMSMTAPRMVSDAASDAGSVFALNMQSNSQWKLEENPGMIKCMAVNPLESMLLTCSRTGVRLWSLTSHPLQHISSYTHHSSPPFAAGFLRNGTSAASCDGNVHIWDIETRSTISFLSAATSAGYSATEKGTGFSSMSIIQPRDGIMPSMGAFGDDQLVTTLGATLSYHDLRIGGGGRGIVPVADWIIPPLPAPQGNFITTTTLEPLQLTCAASHDNYLYTGSSGGGLWIVDRRMGKVLTSWQAHEGPVLKVSALSDKHVLAVSERSAAVWEYTAEEPARSKSRHPYVTRTASHAHKWPHDPHSSGAGGAESAYYDSVGGGNAANGGAHAQKEYSAHAHHALGSTLGGGVLNRDMGAQRDGYYPSMVMGLGDQGEVKKVLNIKNMPDCPFTSSTLMLPALEVRGSSSMNGMNGQEKGLGMPSKPQFVLYCIAGHKLYAGTLPSYDKHNREMIHMGNNAIVDMGDYDELRLSQSYFVDRKGTKIPRNKLNVTSSVLLPLRRLLLVGTDDGLIRIVS